MGNGECVWIKMWNNQFYTKAEVAERNIMGLTFFPFLSYSSRWQTHKKNMNELQKDILLTHEFSLNWKTLQLKYN